MGSIVQLTVDCRESQGGEEGILVSFDGLFVPLPGSKFIYLTRPLGLKIYMKI